MNTAKPNAAALKAERDRDKVQAMREYEADERAWQANLLRLRALRLARERTLVEATPARRPVAKKAPSRKPSPTRMRSARRVES
jgi:hypothetical protein